MGISTHDSIIRNITKLSQNNRKSNPMFWKSIPYPQQNPVLKILGLHKE